MWSIFQLYLAAFHSTHALLSSPNMAKKTSAKRKKKSSTKSLNTGTRQLSSSSAARFGADGSTDDRPIFTAIGFLLVGLATILAAAYPSGGLGAWLWEIQDDPSPAWVWACGGVGAICVAIFMLVPVEPYVPSPRATVAAIAAGLALLHLLVFFIAVLF